MSRITDGLFAITQQIREYRLLNKSPSTLGLLSNASDGLTSDKTKASIASSLDDEMFTKLQAIKALPDIIRSFASNVTIEGKRFTLAQAIANNRGLVGNELFHPLDLCFAAIDSIFRLKNEIGVDKFEPGFFDGLQRSLVTIDLFRNLNYPIHNYRFLLLG